MLGFNGERPDPVTGHYLLGNGYRAFNPVLMRFNSPDSLSPFGKGGVNTYAYCWGDPVNLEDPSGRTPSALGLFQYIKQMPDVLDNIIQRLPTKDMVSLAQTSKTMKHVVYDSAKKLPTEINEITQMQIYKEKIVFTTKNLNPSSIDDSVASIILDIATGKRTGILPVQLPRSGVTISVLGSNIQKSIATYYPGKHYEWFKTTEPFYSTPKSQWSSEKYRYFDDGNLTWTIRSLT